VLLLRLEYSRCGLSARLVKIRPADGHVKWS